MMVTPAAQKKRADNFMCVSVSFDQHQKTVKGSVMENAVIYNSCLNKKRFPHICMKLVNRLYQKVFAEEVIDVRSHGTQQLMHFSFV